MILVSVRNQHSFRLTVGNCLEKRQCILAGILRVHSAIQHESVSPSLKIIGIRADLGLPSEINEFHCSYLRCDCRMLAASYMNHYQQSGRSALQNVLENPKPIAAQNLFYVSVV